MRKYALIILSLLPINFAYAESWSYGFIDITESYSNMILIRWNGPNTENCSSSNVVVFDNTSLGDAEALKRAFSIALAAEVSQKPIRFHLNGCIDTRQKAVAVQMCSKQNCSYQ